MSKDIIGFSKYTDKDGNVIYGCRGIGETYDKLYNKFLPNTSYKCVREDFPWDYFVFEDPDDEKKFLEEFVTEKDIIFEGEWEWENTRKELNEMTQEIINEAFEDIDLESMVKEEIDKELLERIKRLKK